jgi:hypothetical protein
MSSIGSRCHSWLCNYCRLGIASLSLLYLVMGGLTALGALGLGGEKTDQRDVFPFLFRQPLGRITISLLAAGICGYVLWRLYQVWFDPAGHGRGPLGLFMRTGYALSAAFHASLAFYAFRIIWDNRARNEPESAPELAGALMAQPHGQDLVRVAAMIILIVGIVQFYRAFTERFRRQIADPETNRKHDTLIRWSGRFGFTARGVVMTVIAWMLFRAGEHSNPGEAGGVDGVWSFLQTGPFPFGPVTLATVSGCLAVYGIFLAVKAWGLQEDLIG